MIITNDDFQKKALDRFANNHAELQAIKINYLAEIVTTLSELKISMLDMQRTLSELRDGQNVLPFSNPPVKQTEEVVKPTKKRTKKSKPVEEVKPVEVVEEIKSVEEVKSVGSMISSIAKEFTNFEKVQKEELETFIGNILNANPELEKELFADGDAIDQKELGGFIGDVLQKNPRTEKECLRVFLVVVDIHARKTMGNDAPQKMECLTDMSAVSNAFIACKRYCEAFLSYCEALLNE